MSCISKTGPTPLPIGWMPFVQTTFNFNLKCLARDSNFFARDFAFFSIGTFAPLP